MMNCSTKKRPLRIDTIEKLINLDGELFLTSTSLYKKFKKSYLYGYGSFGTYETIFYNKWTDMFCDDDFNEISSETAHKMAMMELLSRD